MNQGWMHIVKVVHCLCCGQVVLIYGFAGIDLILELRNVLKYTHTSDLLEHKTQR